MIIEPALESDQAYRDQRQEYAYCLQAIDTLFQEHAGKENGRTRVKRTKNCCNVQAPNLPALNKKYISNYIHQAVQGDQRPMRSLRLPRLACNDDEYQQAYHG